MAVAMRKKRAWSTRADDAESQETAAFEASVAAAKDTAAKSGEFLSTAKSDLTEHQRWLRAQSAAVERDRARHDRWLRRQRDYRQAAARKERLRRRRRLMRRRAFQAVRHAVWAGLLFLRSWIVFAGASLWAGITSLGNLIARGATYVSRQVAAGIRYAARAVARGTSYAVRQTVAGVTFVARTIARGTVFVAGRVAAGAVYVSRQIAAGAQKVAQASARGVRFLVRKGGAGTGYLADRMARGTAYLARTAAAGVGHAGRVAGRGARAVARKVQAGGSLALAQLGVAARQSGKGLSAGATWTGAKVVASARTGGLALTAGSSFAASKAGALSRSAGRSLGRGVSAASVRGAELADTTGRAAFRGAEAVGKKAAAAQAAGKKGLAIGWRWTTARAAAVTPALYVGLAKLGRQAERYARAGAARTEALMARAAAKAAKPATAAEIFGPHPAEAKIAGRPANDPWEALEEPSGSLDQGPEHVPTPDAAAYPDPDVETAEVYGPFYEGFWVEGVSPNEPRVQRPEPEPAVARESSKNAVSSGARIVRARAGVLWARVTGAFASWVRHGASWARHDEAWAAHAQAWIRTRDLDLSRMMIIAGAVLLVCGGLLLGGGLFLRAGTGPTAQAAADEETGAGIAWTFQETGLPLPDRAVFTLSGTPASFRINGLSLGGVNLSEHTLTGMEGVLKPDVKRPDLKLSLEVDKDMAPAGEGDAEVEAPPVAPDAVPAGASFRLVFLFPPEAMDGEDGITVEEYFDSYGGLLLKLRYAVDGTQKSLIQYLPPDMLKAQLDEVSAEAGG